MLLCWLLHQSSVLDTVQSLAEFQLLIVQSVRPFASSTLE